MYSPIWVTQIWHGTRLLPRLHPPHPPVNTMARSNGTAASQGQDAPVVNKNKRFRKDKRVTLTFSVLHLLE